MIRGAGIHDPVSDSRWSEANGAEGVGQSLLIPGAGPGRLGRGLVHLLLWLLLMVLLLVHAGAVSMGGKPGGRGMS